jgi:hypothetical protein
VISNARGCTSPRLLLTCEPAAAWLAGWLAGWLACEFETVWDGWWWVLGSLAGWCVRACVCVCVCDERSAIGAISITRTPSKEREREERGELPGEERGRFRTERDRFYIGVTNVPLAGRFKK